MYYDQCSMKSISLKIDEQTDRWLESESKRLGRTKSQIAREALERGRNGEKKLSLHDRMKHVCGIMKGAPRDLSSNQRKYMKDFGR